MDFDFSEDQEALRDAVRKWVGRSYAFERRREIALLRAVGYAPANLFRIVLAENAVLLGCGLAVGAISAFIAVAPAAIQRGARLPVSAGGALLLLAVLGAGLLSSFVATRAALRESLLGALRSD